MTRICYDSFADKRQKYVAKTIPAIFAMATHADYSKVIRSYFPDISASRSDAQKLQALHSAVRRHVYVREFGACDIVQAPLLTIRRGGDCEDWAAVIMAALGSVPHQLVTAGDENDPFRHVYVRAFADGAWYTLDPKGDQIGVDFNKRSENYPEVRFWSITTSGQIIEVTR